MSARRQFDAHMTDSVVACAIAQRLVEVGLLTTRSRVLEPSAGDGAFVRAVRSVMPGARITALDIRVQLPKLTTAGANVVHLGTDFLAFKEEPFDLVVGNPPFGRRGEGLVERHVEHALGLTGMGGHVAFLARFELYASVCRTEFWRTHPPTSVDVLVPRPSFSDNGRSDRQEYAVYTWQKVPLSGSRADLGRLEWR